MQVMLMTIVLACCPAVDGDNSALDKQVYEVLKDLNNRGADLHNAGDTIGAYRLYQGGLVVLRPLLTHRTVAQKTIDDGLKAAETKAITTRSIALHTTITELRALLKPGVTQLHNPTPVAPAGETAKPGPVLGGEGAKPMPPKMEDKSPPPNPQSFPPNAGGLIVPPTTLWDRLGGQTRMEKIVDAWLTAALADPKVDLTRGGLLKLEGEDLVKCKGRLVGYVSNLSEGTVPYSGKTLADAHVGIPTAGEGFTALVGHLKKALADNGAAAADVEAIVKKVEATK